jgi:hypothetical protein
MTDQEPDFPVKIADGLEAVAEKARSLTVGKAENVGKWAAAGTVLVFIGIMAVIFLLIGVSRILGEAVGTEVAYAIIGGLFLIAALLIWRMRDPKEPDA